MVAQLSQPVDALALRGRLRLLQIGAWPGVFACCCCAVYAGLTWEQPHRAALVTLNALTSLACLVIACAPLDSLLLGLFR